jgi:hypothetical protein
MRPPPRSPAQIRFPGADGIVFDFPWLCRWSRGKCGLCRRESAGVAKNAAPVSGVGKHFPGRNSRSRTETGDERAYVRSPLALGSATTPCTPWALPHMPVACGIAWRSQRILNQQPWDTVRKLQAQDRSAPRHHMAGDHTRCSRNVSAFSVFRPPRSAGSKARGYRAAGKAGPPACVALDEGVGAASWTVSPISAPAEPRGFYIWHIRRLFREPVHVQYGQPQDRRRAATILIAV